MKWKDRNFKPNTASGRRGARRAIAAGGVAIGLAALLPTAVVAQSAALFGAIPGRLHLNVPQVEGVRGIRERVAPDGKLHLKLADFLQLVLANSTAIHMLQLNNNTAQANLLSAYSPFDPNISIGFNANRSQSPEASQIQGAATLSSLSQNSSANYSETLMSGQLFQIGFSTNRSSNNSLFNTFNPSLSTGLNLSVTQDLWRNRGNLQNKASLLIARSQILVVTDQTSTSVADQLVTAANQYWGTVESRDQIDVAQQALDLAKKSNQRDQQALDLGALAPGDIFTSQAQVAQDEVSLLQAQSSYRQNLDLLRRSMGADLSADTRNVEIVLEDDPSGVTPVPPALSADDAVEQALRERPELDVYNRQLQQSSISIAQAQDALHPTLNLSGNYGSNALAGQAVATSSSLGVGSSTAVTSGFYNALGQLFSANFPTYGFSLNLTLPVKSSAATAQLTNSLINKTNEEYGLRNEQQQVIQDVRLADTQLRMAVATVQSAITARDLSQKNVDSEQQKYTLGTITVFELLQAQVQLSNAQSTVVNAYTNYQEALIAYERATWTLLDKLNLSIAAAGQTGRR